jgi:hypothetical protein
MKGIRVDGKSFLVGTAFGLSCGVVAGILVIRKERRAFEERFDREIAELKAHYSAQANAASKRDHADEWSATSMGASGVDEGERAGLYGSGVDYGNPAAISSAAPGPVPDTAGPEPSGGLDPLEGYTGDYEDDEDDAGGDGADQQDHPETREVRASTQLAEVPPYLIKEWQFFEECETYSKSSVTWFAGGEGVLVDERDVPMDDVLRTTGMEFINVFMKPDRPTSAYVRNDRIEHDFEIVWDGRAYSDVVFNPGVRKP